jgi:hypothetical protein
MKVKPLGFRARAARVASALSVVCLAWALSSEVPARVPGGASPAAVAERVTQAGEVVVVLNEGFINALLDAITSQRVAPTFPLSRGDNSKSQGKCASEITLLREAKGARTAVRFDGGLITARIAFRGSYDAPLVGCLKFEGWADTVFGLEFDRERQLFGARITVRDVSLKNVPSLMNSSVAGLVQEAIAARVNPVKILRAEQLGARLPLTGDTVLRLRAAEVRHEVVGKELRLRIVYEIVGDD